MKIVQVNATCGTGSTGNICVAVSEILAEQGIENYILYSSGSSEYSLGIKYATDGYLKRQAIKSRILGNYGFNSKLVTRRLIEEIDRIAPDIIHLHNLHSHNCNLIMLFDYFRMKGIKLFWTFHDCWAFTGYCSHFVIAKCDKWITGCSHCPQYKMSSWFLDRSSEMYSRKKKMIEGVDLTIITPSKWLANLVKQSYFMNCPVKVINNGINLDVFKPTESDFRERYGLNNKKIVLGVSFGWGYSKGLDVFIELSKILSNDYSLIIVGTDKKIDKQLPSNVISIHRTANQHELAQIYSAADVFVNATRQDTFPTVNMEAIACGTPVVTFCTGGSPEIVNEQTGFVVECDDIQALKKYIVAICTKNLLSSEKIVEASKEFSQNQRFEDYVSLYC